MERTELRTASGQRIRRLRRESELTVTAVAKEARITRQYLHEIERGTYTPSDELQARIAKALGVTAAELFEEAS